jgi:outer membrane protein assembly factor BamD (BamD/ComL family)
VPGPGAGRSAAAASDDAKKTRASRLAEESRMVLEARNALRSGDLGGALRLLDAAKTEFQDGALTQEREALTIEALARSGRREIASRRAEAFLRDYPKSPHASDVRRWVVLP